MTTCASALAWPVDSTADATACSSSNTFLACSASYNIIMILIVTMSCCYNKYHINSATFENDLHSNISIYANTE